MPGIAEDDGDGDGVDGDIGWPEFGAVVIAVLADLLGDLAGLVEVVVGKGTVVVVRGADRHDEMAGVYSLGVLLQDSDPAQAREWLQRAAAAGRGGPGQ